MNEAQQKERTTLGIQLRAEMRQLNSDVEIVVGRYQADAKAAVLNALEETKKVKADLKKEFDDHVNELEVLLKMRGLVQAEELRKATEPLRRGFWGRVKWAIRGI